MQRWDYAIVTTTDEDGEHAQLISIDLDLGEELHTPGKVKVIALLDQMGKQGWELVDSQPVGKVFRYIFKRPLRE